MPDARKDSVEDTPLVIGNEAGGTAVLPIPGGSRTFVDAPGPITTARATLSSRRTKVVYRELRSMVSGRSFVFKLERFMGEWDMNAFIQFPGARAHG